MSIICEIDLLSLIIKYKRKCYIALQIRFYASKQSLIFNGGSIPGLIFIFAPYMLSQFDFRHGDLTAAVSAVPLEPEYEMIGANCNCECSVSFPSP